MQIDVRMQIGAYDISVLVLCKCVSRQANKRYEPVPHKRSRIKIEHYVTYPWVIIWAANMLKHLTINIL